MEKCSVWLNCSAANGTLNGASQQTIIRVTAAGYIILFRTIKRWETKKEEFLGVY
jgi:hypothetical protein